MSRCTIDHSLEDVLLKLKEQQAFFPGELYDSGLQFLDETRDQETLNEVFHLLKKYDLAEDEERGRRNEEMRELFD
ncbi:group-specific protein [Sporosarcina sp. Sa2YVA2]|uniref:Group-specific protein n=1 Tax=Sporosarcina quadrami TaxID=2762234 RepID=A0ABR8U7S9_9BACL|nr:group-specific protein [Sporosarcina quadrami]MBD7984098.1 group-specific protein [Sporosarcina quadrami]